LFALGIFDIPNTCVSICVGFSKYRDVCSVFDIPNRDYV